MGVTGLWTVVSPTARPTQLATLNRKRLAVDASIWIYQFLKAVRDKEGNALRNSHVVGFFRRICKLLYFGVKPVFVFDGGAPALKRETVRGRRQRREGRREDAVRTAGRLLGVHMRRLAEEAEEAEGERRRRKRRGEGEGDRGEEAGEKEEEEEQLPPEEEIVYVDEMGMSQSERQANRSRNEQPFRKKDQYHLPDLDTSIDSMGAPNDPRIMSQAELEEYARQFHSGEDVNLYDFSKIDFESAFFLSLPPSDRYNILNAARLRSRLRMGYTKEQLDGMFPDRMAFSRFQIDRVRERNELTQRLMHVNGMADDFLQQGGRIAGEKGKEYVLVKNEGVEGGWALGVVSNKGKHEDDAIDLDAEFRDDSDQEEEEEEEGEEEVFEDVAIEGLNRLPRRWARNPRDVDYNPDYKEAAEEIAEKRRAVYEARREAASGGPVQRSREPPPPESDDLFVAQDHGDAEEDEEGADELFEDLDMATGETDEGDEQDDLQRAIRMSLQGRDDTEDGSLNDPGQAEDDANEDGYDLQAALAESRKSKYRSKDHDVAARSSARPPARPPTKTFAGPLPFESLNLGQSLLGKKKTDKIEQDQAGGFEREPDPKKTEPAPLPSWFEAKDWSEGPKRVDRDPGDGLDRVGYAREECGGPEALLKNSAQDIIDVEEPSPRGSPEQIEIESSESGSTAEGGPILQDTVSHDPQPVPREDRSGRDESQTGADHVARSKSSAFPMDNQARPPGSPIPGSPILGSTGQVVTPTSDDLERAETSGRGDQMSPAISPDPESEVVFEDVALGPGLEHPTKHVISVEGDVENNPHLVSGPDDENGEGYPPDATDEAGNGVQGEGDYLSDSDEELMRQMATEAEEHARFTSSLNNAPTGSSTGPLDFENELKQLRNQQKRDRRDADEVTQIMIQECQALLRLFGLPYITAPQEAEAQCAELVRLGLVDGIVTDDSDIFLFGGTRIYKNMFNAAKFVECYLSTDLEKEYGLDRVKLIRLAHLLGSDYTEGIAGIGPVTALEIITEFDSLEVFRDWCAAVQMEVGPGADAPASAFGRKFKKQARKLLLPLSFPDVRVDDAYLHPDVDSDPSALEWGVPDLDALRSFLMATIGWSQERTDEVLVPVIRDMNRRGVEGTQSNVTRFFGGGVGVGGREAGAPTVRKKSGRMEKAFGRLRGRVAKGREREAVAEGEGEGEGVKRKRADNGEEGERSHDLQGDETGPKGRRRGGTKSRR